MQRELSIGETESNDDAEEEKEAVETDGGGTAGTGDAEDAQDDDNGGADAEDGGACGEGCADCPVSDLMTFSHRHRQLTVCWASQNCSGYLVD